MIKRMTINSRIPRPMAAPSVSRGVLGNCIIIADALVADRFRVYAVRFLGESGRSLPASVTDERGELVTGLTKEDFEVNENNEPQTVTTFAEADFPLTAVVGLDRSFSMAGERLAIAKVGGEGLPWRAPSEDKAAVLAIGSRVETVAPLSTDRRAQFAALAGLDVRHDRSLRCDRSRPIDPAWKRGAGGRCFCSQTGTTGAHRTRWDARTCATFGCDDLSYRAGIVTARVVRRAGDPDWWPLFPLPQRRSSPTRSRASLRNCGIDALLAYAPRRPTSSRARASGDRSMPSIGRACMRARDELPLAR